MMSEMARDFFSDNPAIAGPLVAMLIFSIVFTAAVVRVVRAKKDHIDRLAHLALEGEGDREVRHG